MYRRILALLVGLAVGIFFIGTVPVAQGDTDYSIVRVRLASMGNPVSVKVRVNGNYSIPENKDIYLERGKEYEIAIQDGNLVLRGESQVYTLGSSFTFKQHKGGDSDALGVLNPSYGWTNYKGDMVVSLEGGYIRLTNHVYLETYLYGVVPYEMNNIWPLEALKAQAVAARTYAVRCKKSASAPYDVVDTQADQVYRGYNPNFGNCIRAVDETSRMILKYNGNFLTTYYSSSNGGWIEAGYEVFSSVPKGFVPLSAKQDPYDPKSQWSFNIYKTQIDVNNIDLANPNSWWDSIVEKDISSYKSFIDGLKEKIKKSTGALDVKIVSIDEILFEGETEGKRKKEVNFKLSFFSKGMDGYVMDEQGKIKLETADVRMQTKDMRSLIGTSIMRSLYITGLELRNVEKPGREYYVIWGLGFGHGVGMSQFGAKAMAEQNKSYKEILNFYYPEASIEVINISPPTLSDMPSRGGERQDPQPSNSGNNGQQPSNGGGNEQSRAIYGTVKVTTSLNIRQGPGTQYKRIGGLAPNTRVQILREVGDWYEVKAGNLQGYVHRDYVILENAQQPSGSSSGGDQGQQPPVDPPVPPNNERKYAVVTASTLNVRSGPSTKNHKIGMVVKGNKLIVLEKSGEWYKIEYNGLIGYVHGDYIRLESSSAQLPSEGSALPSSNNGNVIAQGTVTTTTLNVRSGAGTGFSVIGKLTRNAKVDILEKAGAWYKIKYGSTVGYVHGDYIELISGDVASRGAQQISTGIVTVNGLNVRSGPGTNYNRIGFLNRNSQVTILGQSGVWYKIKFGNTTGYVHSAYVKVSNAVTSREGDDRRFPNTALVTATWLNVRTGPGINYAKIGVIKINSRVTILQKEGSWYKVSYGTLTGYVSGDYLKF
ncbi:SpoIID/LytB domain protein [Caldicoprobacter guelmensis]|uniref:SH3 domain-containing protein n=1 Tax=Caldicoprobacter guelmensis TaxID=1170224 RepID=UPI00195789EE|nr:SH3 domain-containing protein [Caldicoprobacter guelmensis]MBM7583382.1 SpoIID/LytB domain protein [Caldicoprobacter guelmensis]